LRGFRDQGDPTEASLSKPSAAALIGQQTFMSGDVE
jgi:hypothetical protein